ncbi:translation initiation factor IF-2-like [Oryx dammah]|uniref:translation initiation factor IF-2-like n=1 Tax=Oryx dammah TaxID=59534 RepID=UPI001A9B4D20|nr:translation initiation factor IF-2-like [Oryx dammah]
MARGGGKKAGSGGRAAAPSDKAAARSRRGVRSCAPTRRPSTPESVKVVSAPAPPSLHTPSGECGSKKRPRCYCRRVQRQAVEGRGSRQRGRAGEGKENLERDGASARGSAKRAPGHRRLPEPGLPALGPGRPRTQDRKSWTPEARAGPSLPHQASKAMIIVSFELGVIVATRTGREAAIARRGSAERQRIKRDPKPLSPAENPRRRRRERARDLQPAQQPGDEAGGGGGEGSLPPWVRTEPECMKGRAAIKTDQRALLRAGQGRAFASEGARGGREGAGGADAGGRARGLGGRGKEPAELPWLSLGRAG